MDVAASPNDPPGYLWLNKLLPITIVINTIANFFTLLISLGNYGGRYWADAFEIFISLAWFFFLIALTLGIIGSMILVHERHHVIDAFGRGKDGYRKWRDGGLSSKRWIERCSVGFVVKIPLGLVIVLIMVLGFMFCALAVAQHSSAVGWVGFVWTVLMMILAVVAWILMDHS